MPNPSARLHGSSLCASLFVVTAVAACGGGSGDSASADAAGVAAPSLDEPTSSPMPGDPRSSTEQSAEALETRASGMTLVAATLPDAAKPAAVVPATVQPPRASTAVWTKVADENGRFLLEGIKTVRYGADTKWLTKALAGTVTCSNGFFGSDPSVNVVKRCEVMATAGATPPIVDLPPAAPIDMHFGAISPLLFPKGDPGYAEERLKPTTEVAPDSDIGAFRTTCTYSHMGYDDPIVYPGKKGMSHLHVFFGNTGVTANSTAESIRTTGNSTCRGGTANRSAYWVPAMIDASQGVPIKPDSNGVYYKSGYELPPSVINALPTGLRMVVGDAAGSSAKGGPYGFECYGAAGQLASSGTRIPDCPAGTTSLLSTLTFQQCWDGKNLDSPDHKSHMSGVAQLQSAPYTKYCPASHPVAIPAIAFNIWYPVGPGGTRNWRLASDMYDASSPGGYSMHGDWFNGWKKEVSDSWAKNCLLAKKDCHSHLVGDGRAMY